MARDSGQWLKGQKVIKGKGNAKTHGHIPGIAVGSTFKNRVECAAARVHAPLRAGIHGNKTDGAYSIVMSYGYEDDDDRGETVFYSGEGGRDTSGGGIGSMQGKERWEGPRARNQEWTKGNLALKISSKSKKPVRVIRGQSRKFFAKYAPSEGYRYDGLYIVEKAWDEKGLSGFLTCRFLLKRLPDQPPLPIAKYQMLGRKTEKAKVSHVPVLGSPSARSNQSLSSEETSPVASLQKLSLDASDSSGDENHPPAPKQKQRQQAAGSLIKAKIPPAVGTSNSASAAVNMSNTRGHSSDAGPGKQVSESQTPSWEEILRDLAPKNAYAGMKLHKKTDQSSHT